MQANQIPIFVTMINYTQLHLQDIILTLMLKNFLINKQLKKEATISFCNLLITIERKQIEEFLKEYDGVQLLVDQMKYADIDLNIKIVKALFNVMKMGESIKKKKNYFYNIYAKKFNQYGGREKLDQFAESQNNTLKKFSEKLLAISYLLEEADDEMEQQYQEDNNNDFEDNEEEDQDQEEDDDDDENEGNFTEENGHNNENIGSNNQQYSHFGGMKQQ